MGVAVYSNDDVKLRDALAHGRELERELSSMTERWRLQCDDAEQARLEQAEAALSAIAPKPASLLERTAQIAAHRACCGTEHDPANGKLHGCCVVCGVPWPCKFAGKEPAQGIAFDPISGEPYRYAPPAVTPQKGKLVADWHECRTCGAQILGGAHREPDNSSDGGKQADG